MGKKNWREIKKMCKKNTGCMYCEYLYGYNECFYNYCIPEFWTNKNHPTKKVLVLDSIKIAIANKKKGGEDLSQKEECSQKQ